MSQTIDINGVTFVTTRTAAKLARYSHDYLSKLARDGRVKAVQIGRQWYVDPVSLESFLTSAKLEKEVRRRQLRHERREERQAKELRERHEQNVVGRVVESNSVENVETPRTSLYRFRAVATAITAFFLFVAAGFSGSAAYLSIVAMLSLVSSELHQPITVFTVPPIQTSSVQKMPMVASVSDAPTYSSGVAGVLSGQEVEEDAIATSGPTMVTRVGYVLLGTSTDPLMEASLFDLFSDEVIVEYDAEHRGVVTPILQGGELGQSVRFLEVPVKQDNG